MYYGSYQSFSSLPVNFIVKPDQIVFAYNRGEGDHPACQPLILFRQGDQLMANYSASDWAPQRISRTALRQLAHGEGWGACPSDAAKTLRRIASGRGQHRRRTLDQPTAQPIADAHAGL